LRECTDRAGAFEAIREIVSNLLGCEEMALFQLNRKQNGLRLIWSFGIKSKPFRLPEMFRDFVLFGAIAGGTYVANESGEHGAPGRKKNVSAFVPIQFKGEAAGVLILLRLLPQKARIDELDRELFAILSQEAGEPLFGGATSCPAKQGRNR